MPSQMTRAAFRFKAYRAHSLRDSLQKDVMEVKRPHGLKTQLHQFIEESSLRSAKCKGFPCRNFTSQEAGKSEDHHNVLTSLRTALSFQHLHELPLPLLLFCASVLSAEGAMWGPRV